MNQLSLSAILALGIFLLLACQPPVATTQRPLDFHGDEPSVIYNHDDRIDASSIGNNLKIHKLSMATAVLFDHSKMKEKRLRSIGESFFFCDSERFLDQPKLGFCSGVLIDSQTVLTAGHCVDNLFNGQCQYGDCPDDRDFCANTRFAFGWGLKQSLWPLPKSQIYHCSRIEKINYRIQQRGWDYALIKLDRPVVGVTPVSLAQTEAQVGQAVISVSHPLGMPQKISIGSVIAEDMSPNFFRSDVDTFRGSSGSPLFSEQGELIGLLSQGSEDFEEEDVIASRRTNQCVPIKRCTHQTCFGERFFKASLIELPR